jgi:hypothetical protein
MMMRKVAFFFARASQASAGQREKGVTQSQHMIHLIGRGNEGHPSINQTWTACHHDHHLSSGRSPSFIWIFVDD